MPNYVTNVLELTCSENRFLEVADFLKGKFDTRGEVDFDALIPMPKELDIECGSRGQVAHSKYISFMNELKEGMTKDEAEELEAKYKSQLQEEKDWELGKQYYENKENFGCTTWYDWCCKYWGTKWNAMDCEYNPILHSFKFETAWSCVRELVRLLSIRYPEIVITYSYADEDYGYNVGRFSFQNGEYIEVCQPDGGSKEAFELAAEIMDIDLEELGYLLTEDGTSYMYVE